MEPTQFEVDIDHCDVRVSRAGGTYVTFNVLFRFGPVGVLTCNWRFQDGVLYGPYRMLAGGRFFTHTYVTEETARAIYEQVVADLQRTPGAPEIQWMENGWKAAVYYPQQLKKMMPDYYQRTHIEETKPKVEGKAKSLRITREEPTEQEETTAMLEDAIKPKRFQEPTREETVEAYQQKFKRERPYGWHDKITPEEEIRKWQLMDSMFGGGSEARQ